MRRRALMRYRAPALRGLGGSGGSGDLLNDSLDAFYDRWGCAGAFALPTLAGAGLGAGISYAWRSRKPGKVKWSDVSGGVAGGGILGGIIGLGWYFTCNLREAFEKGGAEVTSTAGLGASEGYKPPFECSDFIIRPDGRCADTGGTRSLAWYDINIGQCVDPPPISCDVNAGNLPQSCPPGMMLNSAVPSGCSPAPGGSEPGPPAPVGPSQPGPAAQPSPQPPVVKKASFLDTMKNNPVATAAVVGGVLLIAAGFANPQK